jgi:NAD(P)-dependent dehydrogenase (short-subunit alcohol dehydrogenase family)
MLEPEFNGTAAYARSKRAQVILTEEWAQRVRPELVSFHAMHPGWVDTPGLERSLPRFRGLLRSVLRTPEQGADTIVWLGAAPSGELGSGRFWHDRRSRPVHLVPWTRENAGDRAALWARCEELVRAYAEPGLPSDISGD